MEGRYEFTGREVLSLLEESRRAEARLWTEAQRYVQAGVDLAAEEGELGSLEGQPESGAPPGLWLMNDRGIYLRSNARERPAESVAWADAWRAEVQVGDEPMCEFIDAETLAPLEPDDTLVVTITPEKLRLSVIRD